MKLTKMMNEKQLQELITATVSHDMKTPLNSIIMTSEQLAEFTTGNELAEKLRKINLSAGKLLFSLVSDLLDLYQIKKGKFVKRLKEFNIRDYVENIRRMIDIQIAHRPLSLQVNLVDEIPERVIFDGDRISQVLINLLSNALKFTQKGYIRITGTYYKDV